MSEIISNQSLITNDPTAVDQIQTTNDQVATVPQGYIPTESQVYVFKGIKGSIDDENDRHSDKAVALRALKLIFKARESGTTMYPTKYVVDSLEGLGYEVKSIADLQLIKKLEEDYVGGVRTYDNGTVIAVASIPIGDTRKILASPEDKNDDMALQKLASEVIVFEEDDQPRQAVETVVMMGEVPQNLTNNLLDNDTTKSELPVSQAQKNDNSPQSIDYSFLLQQDPQIVK